MHVLGEVKKLDVIERKVKAEVITSSKKTDGIVFCPIFFAILQ